MRQSNNTLPIPSLPATYPPLPPPPTSKAAAITALQQFQLPSRQTYTEHSLYQLRIITANLMWLRSCMRFADADKGEWRLFQSSVYYKDSDNRKRAFDQWQSGMTEEAIAELDQGNISEELMNYALVGDGVRRHTISRSHLYLMATPDHPVFGLSWDVKRKDVDINDEEARAAHEDREGVAHEYAILTQNRNVGYKSLCLILS